ncbi:MAG: GTP 3',8-cyclase MoaA [Gammaproteobacteria bacterium]|nr:GTP 3',8-cyclase MoaA [Gammaproteobacteria bacterium]
MSGLAESKLVDRFGREVRYLRLSVTDRCNLRCTYCMAEDMKFLPKARVLSLEEMVLVSEAFVELGVEKIRLTGGEPLVRKGIVELAQSLSQIKGLRELVMTTNGVLLTQYAKDLKQAGVSRINISIDSLKHERFRKLTRFGALTDVLNGIEAAKEAGFERIKLNAVILRGINDDEVLSLAEFAVSHGLDISYIEEMPLGEIGSHNRSETAVANISIKDLLSRELGLDRHDHNDSASGPSKYMKVTGTASRVGFISPMTENFCASCNRVRVTAEGRLLLCLGNEHSLNLRSIIRDRPKDLKQEILASIVRKPQKHEFDPNDITITRHMSATGG